MILVRSGIVWLATVFLAAASASGHAASRPESPPGLDEIIQKAVACAQHSPSKERPARYTYTKASIIEQLDATGHVKERKEKVYQVSFRDGLTYARLVEVDGHAPARADLKKQAENEVNVRQLLGQNTPAGDNRESLLTPELVARFDFKLLGQDTINGRAAYRISFQPKIPEPPARHIVDRLLNRISGTLWIDAGEFEVARAQIQLGSEVDFLGGVIGCLKKLAFTITRTRLADGVWLNSDSSGDFEGRKLLDFLRIKTKSQSTNFRPLAQNSSGTQAAG